MENKFCLKSRKELDEIRKQKAEAKKQVNEISDETVYSAVAKAQDKALKSLRKDPDKRNFLRDANKLNNIYNAGLRREWRKKGLKNPVGMSAKQLGKVWDKDYEPIKTEYDNQLKKRNKIDAFGNEKNESKMNENSYGMPDDVANQVKASIDKYISERGNSFEVYVDYKDKLEDSTVKEIFESTKPLDAFYEIIGDYDWWESADYDYDYIFENNLDLSEEIKEEFRAEILDMLRDYVSYEIPYDHFNETVGFDVYLHDADSANREYSDMLVFEETEEQDEDGDYIKELTEINGMLTKFLATQGYTAEQFIEYYNKKQSGDEFLDSLISEIDNTNYGDGSGCQVAFLVQAPITAMAEAIQNGGSLTIPKTATCGLVESFNGSGGPLEIKLKQNITGTLREQGKAVYQAGGDFEVYYKHGYGYNIDDIYGLVSSAWDTDAILNKSESLTAKKALAKSRTILEEYGEYQGDPNFEEIARQLEYGNTYGSTTYEAEWGEVEINGTPISDLLKTNEVIDWVSHELSYPVRDGHAYYSGLNIVFNNYSYENTIDHTNEDVIADLVALGFDEDSIREMPVIKDPEYHGNMSDERFKEIETWINYDINYKEPEEDEEYNESLSKADKRLAVSNRPKLKSLADDIVDLGVETAKSVGHALTGDIFRKRRKPVVSKARLKELANKGKTGMKSKNFTASEALQESRKILDEISDETVRKVGNKRRARLNNWKDDEKYYWKEYRKARDAFDKIDKNTSTYTQMNTPEYRRAEQEFDYADRQWDNARTQLSKAHDKYKNFNRLDMARSMRKFKQNESKIDEEYPENYPIASVYTGKTIRIYLDSEFKDIPLDELFKILELGGTEISKRFWQAIKREKSGNLEIKRSPEDEPEILSFTPNTWEDKNFKFTTKAGAPFSNTYTMYEFKISEKVQGNNLDSKWVIRAWVDNMDSEDGYDEIEFTKIGLIDFINSEEEDYYGDSYDYQAEPVGYDITDEELKTAINDNVFAWVFGDAASVVSIDGKAVNENYDKGYEEEYYQLLKSDPKLYDLEMLQDSKSSLIAKAGALTDKDVAELNAVARRLKELQGKNESMFNKYGEPVDPKEWKNKEARGLNEGEAVEVNIFLTNLGKYNEGELVGEWVKLPVDDFQPILDRIGINDEYEEWFITDYELPFEINEYDNIEELNDIAREIQDFDSIQLEVLDAYKDNGYDMRDAIDKVIDRDYIYLEGNTEEDLAYSYIDMAGSFEDAVSKEDKQYYFDYEAYGRDLVLGGDYSYVDDAVDLNSFADKDTAIAIFGDYGEDLPSEDDIAKYKKWVEIYNNYTDEQEEELAKQGIEVFMSSIYVDGVAYDVETLEQVVDEDYEVQSGYKDDDGNIVNVSSEKELAEYVIDDLLGGVDQMSEDELERYFDYAWWGKTLAYDFYRTDNGWVQLD